jgi:hypothetical protein
MSIWLVSILLDFTPGLFHLGVYDRENNWIVCYLTDVIAVVSGMSAEREYVRDGKITKMLIVELTDYRFFFLFILFCGCGLCCFDYALLYSFLSLGLTYYSFY